jgi:TetR/AcrR family transcriptional repressor of nem operon
MPLMSVSTPSRRPAGRPRKFDMDAALDGALLVFRERGYHAASLSQLGAAMKLTTGSIYKAFSDKRAIFLTAFDRYTDVRNAQLRALLDSEDTGLNKIATMLRFYAEASHGVEGRSGCLVAGSAMELASYDADMADRVTVALHRVETTLRSLLQIQGCSTLSCRRYRVRFATGAEQSNRSRCLGIPETNNF